jgi:hypothetical protein
VRTFGSVAAALGAALAAFVFYLAWYFQWEAKNTSGMAYYGRTPEERAAFKREVRSRSRLLAIALRALSPLGRSGRTMPSVDYGGVSGPPRVSTAETFARAQHYRPGADDVFVATQMRCGTTWMQQVVYQTVTRGRGEFTEPERSHLYAISPWIEGVNSVSIGDAPLVGTPATRIIKTHLPASHCPYNSAAKYIYVARHPVSCFASIVDFNRSMVGPLLPTPDKMAAWFTSDRMYWRPWPEHVNGWWEWSQSRSNVLFVHFEEMKRDLAGVIDRVAAFLGVPLTAEERRLVESHCTFEYMKLHEDWFEMAPPTMFSVAGGRFLASGRANRSDDVPPAIRQQIIDYCKKSLEGSSYPAERFYPDLTS